MRSIAAMRDRSSKEESRHPRGYGQLQAITAVVIGRRAVEAWGEMPGLLCVSGFRTRWPVIGRCLRTRDR